MSETFTAAKTFNWAACGPRGCGLYKAGLAFGARLGAKMAKNLPYF